MLGHMYIRSYNTRLSRSLCLLKGEKEFVAQNYDGPFENPHVLANMIH